MSGINSQVHAPFVEWDHSSCHLSRSPGVRQDPRECVEGRTGPGGLLLYVAHKGAIAAEPNAEVLNVH